MVTGQRETKGRKKEEGIRAKTSEGGDRGGEGTVNTKEERRKGRIEKTRKEYEEKTKKRRGRKRR